MSKKFTAGIDLGTTYSCIAVRDEKTGQAMVLKNAEDQNTTPSVVFFEDKDHITVGQGAKERAIDCPDQVVQMIKRAMGDPSGNRIINGEEMTPPEISSYILKKVVNDGEEALRSLNEMDTDDHIKDVIITVPAYFGVREITATKTAGELAGLNVLQVIQEPTAAAISYGATDDAVDKNVMVFDLGGGTFDITIINIKNNPKRITVIVTGGDSKLGGGDFDKVLKQEIDARYQTENPDGGSIYDDPSDAQDLTTEVEKVKKMLSFKEKVPVGLSVKGKRFRTEITKQEFEALASPLVERCISLVHDTLQEAEKKGCGVKDINRILLVGGSSKMPMIKNRLDKEFPDIPSHLSDPDESVAKGAALYAFQRSLFEDTVSEIAEKQQKTAEEVKNDLKSGADLNSLAEKAGVGGKRRLGGFIDISNVSSRSFGTIAEIEDDDKSLGNNAAKTLKLCNILLKNTNLPAESSESFWPSEDNQSTIRIQIMESISPERTCEPSLGTVIGEMRLDLPQNCSRDDTEILVTYKLNEEGVLSVSAKETKTNKEIHSTFNVKDALSEKEKSEAIRRTSKVSVE